MEQIIQEGFNIGMTQYRKEVEQLVEFLSDKKINNFLEIGTFKGGNFYILSKLSTGIKISVDMKNIQKDDCDYPYDSDVTTKLVEDLGGVAIIGDSHNVETLNKVKFTLNGSKLDLLYIDGDHTYNGAKLDFFMYYPLVKEGGYIIFHDIRANYPSEGIEVYRLWHELKPKYNVVKEIVSEEVIDCGIGIFQK